MHIQLDAASVTVDVGVAMRVCQARSGYILRRDGTGKVLLTMVPPCAAMPYRLAVPRVHRCIAGVGVRGW